MVDNVVVLPADTSLGQGPGPNQESARYQSKSIANVPTTPSTPPRTSAPKRVMHAFVNDLTPIAKVESAICGGSNLMLVNDDWLTLTLDPVDAFWLGDQAE